MTRLQDFYNNRFEDAVTSGELSTCSGALHAEIETVQENLDNAVISGGGTPQSYVDDGDATTLVSANSYTDGAVSTKADSSTVSTLADNLDTLQSDLVTQTNELDAVETILYDNYSSRIAIFDDSGNLTSSGDFSINNVGGLAIGRDETFLNPPEQGGRNITTGNWTLRLAEDVTNDFTNFYNTSINFDPDGSNFNYGNMNPNGNGGLGFLNHTFSSNNNGMVHSVNMVNYFLELAGPSGYTEQAFGFTNSVVVRSGHRLDFTRAGFDGIEISASGNIHSALVSEAALQIREGGYLNDLTGIRFNLNLEQFARINQDANLIAAGVFDQNFVAKNDSEIFGINGLNLAIHNFAQGQYVNGITAYLNSRGTISGNITGFNLGFGNTLDCPNIQGIKVDMGNYDYSQSRRNGMSINNGTINFFNQVSTQPNIYFDQSNLLINLFHVQEGQPITGTEFISHNFSTLFMAEDDFAPGPFGLGAAGLLAGGQVAVRSGKTFDKIQLFLSGLSINEQSDGGIIDTVHVYSSFGLVDLMGGGGTVTLNNLKTFYMEEGSQGANKWGVYIKDDEADNYMAKSLMVGGAVDQITNSGVGLSIGSKTAMKLTGMTVAERDNLTPEFGMIVAIDDDATKELNFYNGTTWVAL